MLRAKGESEKTLVWFLMRSVTSQIVDETEMFSAAFVFSTEDRPWSPVVEDCDEMGKGTESENVFSSL